MPTELFTLAQIFNNRLFRIPDFQRGFAWGEQQLSDFWSDLLRVGSDRMHYCGQLTLEKAPEPSWRLWSDSTWLIEDADFQPLLVVDGQQRLTTTVILLQCLLEDLHPETSMAGQRVSELREKYLAKTHGLLRSCLFGYAKDNPSHEFFCTQILRIPSTEYEGARTVYTANLARALTYFRSEIKKLETPTHRERLFRGLTQRFRFNLHELNDDIDVFVAFETMNNRGKPLTRLELLKNRLIYLSTLANGSGAERQKVRADINAVWRTIYEELGKSPDKSLDDDDFLRAHWIVFFGYDKDEADPLTRFLLNKHFTTERLDKGDLTLGHIQTYAANLQLSARVWQQLHFPEDHEAQLGKEASHALVRLKRLGFGVLRPLLLAALSKEGATSEFVSVLHQAERFLLLVRSFAGTRSHVGEADSYRVAHDLHGGRQTQLDAARMIRDRVSRHFTIDAFRTELDDSFEEDGKGFYELPGLEFVLFEYEEHLRRAAKAAEAKIRWEDFRGARNSVEHVYPQSPESSEWPLFSGYTGDRNRFLTHSLGNLVAVTVAKNASLSRRSFQDKKSGTPNIPGFSQGSFSELRIAQNDDWSPKDILARGLELLEFIEGRWEVSLGDEASKTRLLKLEFLNKAPT